MKYLPNFVLTISNFAVKVKKPNLTTFHFLLSSSKTGGFLAGADPGAVNFLNCVGEYGRGARADFLAGTGAALRRFGFLCVFISSVTFLSPKERKSSVKNDNPILMTIAKIKDILLLYVTCYELHLH